MTRDPAIERVPQRPRNRSQHAHRAPRSAEQFQHAQDGIAVGACDAGFQQQEGGGIIRIDAMRLQAFPFPASVAQFLADHEEVFVVEQNRDAQMHCLLVNELDVDPARLVRVLHFDGTPITARFITRAITQHVHAEVIAPQAKSNKSREKVV